MSRTSRLVLGLALVAAPALRAQALQRGFDLERTGRLAEAAQVYFAAARAHPANAAALLGLERVLPQLSRLSELLPLAQRAVGQEPTSDALRGLLLRTYVALDQADSAAAFALRWAEASPLDDQPYREWAVALQDAGRLTEARRVLFMGRRARSRPDALAVELADLAEGAGAWEEAAREWANAVAGTPAHAGTAAERLREVPQERRSTVLGVLTGENRTPAAQRLAAELVLVWGDPDRAWALFQGTVDGGTPSTVQALRRFAEQAGALGSPAGRRVRGLALARFADLVPPQLAARARADAARALLDAGDHDAAHRVLEVLAADPATAPDVQALAHVALIRALLQAGDLDAAGRRLDSLGTTLGGDDRGALRIELARARLARAQLEEAEAALAGDSSVEATALRGWVALYRGDLSGAAARFAEAGPYAGRPGEATDRSRMLALLQSVGAARSEELGKALLLLARGDSAAAVVALTRAAERRELEAGRPDLLLLAGQVGAGLGGSHDAVALRLFDDVVRTGGIGAAAPAAELAWARVLTRQGKTAEAVEHLEHLILTYPSSAVVPQARRELERARGAIPRS